MLWQLYLLFLRRFDFPGSGRFTVEDDRHHVELLMRGLLQTKLGTLLAARAFEDYRFLFALRRLVFAGHARERVSLHLVETDERLPPAGRLLQQLGLRAQERDGAGRAALHYAAIAGDAEAAAGLLAMRADVDMRVTKADRAHMLGAGCTALQVAALFSPRTEVLTRGAESW